MFLRIFFLLLWDEIQVKDFWSEKLARSTVINISIRWYFWIVEKVFWFIDRVPSSCLSLTWYEFCFFCVCSRLNECNFWSYGCSDGFNILLTICFSDWLIHHLSLNREHFLSRIWCYSWLWKKILILHKSRRKCFLNLLLLLYGSNTLRRRLLYARLTN